VTVGAKCDHPLLNRSDVQYSSYSLQPTVSLNHILHGITDLYLQFTALFSVVDPGMGGLGGRSPPLTKSRGWSWHWRHEAVCLRHGGELSWKQYVMLLSITNVHILVEIISFKALTFGPFVRKWTKSFQLQGA